MCLFLTKINFIGRNIYEGMLGNGERKCLHFLIVGLYLSANFRETPVVVYKMEFKPRTIKDGIKKSKRAHRFDER